MTRRFTGWHLLAMLVAMFGTVIAVNVTMATFAAATFGGTVVDNSYVASQRFNDWLAASRKQEALGWAVRVDVGDDRRPVATLSGRDLAHGATVSATAVHPLGREPERSLGFTPVGVRSFRADEPLPSGRWQLRIDVRQNGIVARFEQDVQA
jgi:nitrogen fixation protein FixH